MTDQSMSERLKELRERQFQKRQARLTKKEPETKPPVKAIPKKK
jgi:hypothetical protein